MTLSHNLTAALFSTLLPATALAADSAPAGAETWNVDPSHTEVGFSVRYALVSDVRGRFDDATGVVHLDPKDITKSTVSFEIKAASIDTRDEKRDGHLRTPDFFDAEKHPTLTFRSTGVKKAGKGKLAVTGDLTIRGVTKKVTFDVEGPRGPVADPWGNQKIGFKAKTKINRQDFGVSWNKTLDAGGLLVGDEVELLIDAAFVKQK